MKTVIPTILILAIISTAFFFNSYNNDDNSIASISLKEGIDVLMETEVLP
jgi:hypothetical protein